MKKHNAEQHDSTLLIRKFYELYPSDSFIDDSSRAELLGAFLAGAEIQRTGDYVSLKVSRED